MSLPATLAEAINTATGSPVKNTSPVSGGDINEAAQAMLADGRQVLVKWNRGSFPGMFTAERKGLELLALANALRIPTVLAHAEAAADCPAFIVLEWLGRGSSTTAVAEALGRGLAAQHRTTAAKFGLDHHNFCGSNAQINTPAADWVIFFGERRLGCQMELAARRARLPGQRANNLEKLISRLGDWLPTHPPASLLHGDLWGGNWLVTAAGEPALIDPAVYYGHREADLSFTELFGGFPTVFYHAYQSAWPLEPGYEERKPLYNLYHLLNHLNLFGESYGGGVDAVLQRYIV
jgi:protein-ribulosamine 3-kinase